MARTMSGPRYASSGGACADSVPNTRPASTSTRSLRGGWASGRVSAGMPPLPPSPQRTAEDALLLMVEQRAVGIDPIRHSGDALGRPVAFYDRHHALPTGSWQLHAGSLDDLVPTLHLDAHVLGGLLRRATHDLGRQCSEARRELALTQRLVDVGVDLVD